MKNININILAILIGVLCMSTTCENENCHKAIPFVNNSEKSLYIIGTPHYPNDTIFRRRGYPTEVNKVFPYSRDQSV